MTIDIDAVIASLTIADKVQLLAGADGWHTNAVPGVPPMRCTDGPAGVRGTSWTGPASASFPCGTALGATFDPQLVEQVGQALGRESRSKGANMLLAPTVNLHRTPIGGRNFECFSEDPVLTAHIAVAYVKGVQSQGVAACIKHFIANDTEFERNTISSEVDQRTLRELYLVPFEAAVRPIDEGGAAVQAIMSSYNKINGTFASEHGPLLRGVLRDEWAWDGVLVSDWFGTHSAAESLEAGLDLEMPGPPRFRGDALLAAVEAGEVGVDRVDESVRRLLTMFNLTGVGDIDTAEVTEDSEATRTVIRQASIAASVLLRNDNCCLPLDTGQTLALIGPNAKYGQIQGGGSARVRANRPSGLLSALAGRGVDVVYEQGCSIDKTLPALRGDFAITYTAGGESPASTATFDVNRLQFAWMENPTADIRRAHFGASISGSFIPAIGGEWQFGLTAVGAATLSVNGQLVCDLSTAQTGSSFFGMGSPEVRGTIVLEPGVPAQVQVQFEVLDFPMLRGLTVGALGPQPSDGIDRAVAAAASANCAVVVVGTNAEWETEGEDRTSMSLPGDQDLLIASVAAVNAKTVVIINAGSPVAMPWFDSVAAVLQVWFPGEELGEAIADMLLGVGEPGGRLPVTIPFRLSDTPAFQHHPGRDGLAVYGEGLFIGYRWYQQHDLPVAAPFGFGLGYTTFDLGRSSVDGSISNTVSRTTGITVSVPVRNVGSRSGSHVVQVYVDVPASQVERPLRTLQGFAKVHLAPDEDFVVEVWLPERAFSVWSPSAQSWVVPLGDYRIMVGSSSADVQLAGVVSVVD